MSDTTPLGIHRLLRVFAQRMMGRGFRLATAESCTGGLLAQWMTTVAGSTKWFECGFVTYSNESKIRVLGVQPGVLDRYGAVSRQVAEQMVQGALRNCAADVAVSITGIAGPSGGSTAKPVGTVYISTAERDQPACTTHQAFEGDRAAIREQSAILALTLLMDQSRE